MTDHAAELERRSARSISWFVVVKTPNVLNHSNGHWRVKARLAAERKAATVGAAPSGVNWQFPVLVVLCRVGVGPRALDKHDNLPAALKHIADGVADVLGIDDGDTRFQVRYEQERALHRADVGVRVTVVQRARVAEAVQLLDMEDE